MGAMCWMPALLTATSRRPSTRATSETPRSTCSSEVTSIARATARPPRSWMALATERAASRLTSVTATAAPSRANPSAIARPSPPPPPVTSIARPASRIGASCRRRVRPRPAGESAPGIASGNGSRRPSPGRLHRGSRPARLLRYGGGPSCPRRPGSDEARGARRHLVLAGATAAQEPGGGEEESPSPRGPVPLITFADSLGLPDLNGDDLDVIHVASAGNYPFIDVDSGGSIDGIIAAADRALSPSDAGPSSSPATARWGPRPTSRTTGIYWPPCATG